MQLLVAVAFLTAGASGTAIPPLPVDAALKVIATTPTYGDLAREIGGELVDVIDLCRATQDMHMVGATPSQMARMQDAGLVLYTGLDAEPWLEPMLRSSGNLALLPGNPHVIAMSDGIPVKEVPSELTRANGDIHAYGNPHLWTDPLAVRTMADHVRDALLDSLPAHADEINARAKAFHDRITARLVEWLKKYAPLKGRRVVTYHVAWPYLLDRFGIELAGTVEPKPRVAPTASHLEKIVETMKSEHVNLIIREPFQSPDATDFLGAQTGAKVLELATHPDAGGNGDAIIAHFEQVLADIAAALGPAPGKEP
ncbi:MAG TPA: metal ABC transporter substrate-binding protein [Planctomycetota bacterium]|nr:metal ABC transporter substrate-binding protein [Planctomycetota bacterium]